jgi:uncharacterized membrane protein
MPVLTRRPLLFAILALAASALGLLDSAPASAHGISSVVYADLRSGDDGDVSVGLQLEYDLLVVSVADTQDDDPLFRQGTAAFEEGDPAAQTGALTDHADNVLAYIAERFTVESAGRSCTLRLGDVTMTEQQGVPYAALDLTAECAAQADGHVVTSRLFPDAEGYVIDTKTILTYDVDGHSGSAALDAQHPSFSTEQSLGERFWEFFVLGAEHLLLGLDHILFLLALIAGSRRLREVILAATSFTVAHSVTFILAATHVVSVPASFIEPVIAISISIVAAWYLFRLWRKGEAATELDADSGPLGLDRAGWLRLGVVFVFGLVHGLGFAAALGIDEPWSWTLLWSLLVFNLGIEVVQIALIVVLFPLLTLLRRRAPSLGMWATAGLAVAVTVAGAFWFVERLLGLGG